MTNAMKQRRRELSENLNLRGVDEIPEEMLQEFRIALNPMDGEIEKIIDRNSIKAGAFIGEEDGEKMVGFASGNGKNTEGKEFVIDAFFVKEEYSNKGIGQGLFYRIAGCARAKGFTSLNVRNPTIVFKNFFDRKIILNPKEITKILGKGIKIKVTKRAST